MGALRRGKDIVSDDADSWMSGNPVLMRDLIGLESDTGKMKVGDGVTEWSELEYVSGGGIDSENWTLTEDAVTSDLVFTFVGGGD